MSRRIIVCDDLGRQKVHKLSILDYTCKPDKSLEQFSIRPFVSEEPGVIYVDEPIEIKKVGGKWIISPLKLLLM